MWLTLSRKMTLQLNQPSHPNGMEAIDASQSVSGITIGDTYYFSAHVNRLGYDGYCKFDMSTDAHSLVSRVYGNDQEASCEAFHASGVSVSAETKLTLSYYCNNEGAKDPIEIWAAFDNVALFAYPAPVSISSTTSSTSSSVTPGPSPTETQLLTNNEFESGEFSPWETKGNPTTEFSVVDGRAAVKYTLPGVEAGYYLQYLTPGIRLGQLFRFQFDVDVSILPGNGKLCHVKVWSGSMLAWSMEIDASRQDSLNLLLKMTDDNERTLITLESGCDEPAVVALDNVYVTASPVGRQLLVNNDFESGGSNPWRTQGFPGVTFNIADGRATINTVTSSKGAGYTFGYYTQSLTPAVGPGEPVNIQLDVHVDIPNVGTTCEVLVHVDVGEAFWQMTMDKTQQHSLDLRPSLPEGAGSFYLWGECTGPAKVAFDNVYFTVYPDLVDPTTSSTSTSSEISTSSESSTSSETSISTSSETSTSSGTSTSTSESSTTSQSATASPRVIPSCPANDKETYTNDDGSQFMIVCSQDYTDNNIVGINPVKAASFSACIDLCMYQGTACVGVSWAQEATDCNLKKMAPSPYTDKAVHSAIRFTRPTLGPPSNELVANGDFATDLSEWTTSRRTQQGNSFVLNDGKA
jgi:hypothetical protein